MDVHFTGIGNKKLNIIYKEDEGLVKIFIISNFDKTKIPILLDSIHVSLIESIKLIYLKDHPINTGESFCIVLMLNGRKYLELISFRNYEKALIKFNILKENLNILACDLSGIQYKNLSEFILKNKLY